MLLRINIELTGSIGWRVEFRPCELQFTDFENAAIAIFIILLSRVIVSFPCNFLIPISRVDENMRRAQERNAVEGQKFYFRTNVDDENCMNEAPEVEEMTLSQIVNGDEKMNFPGLLSMVKKRLKLTLIGKMSQVEDFLRDQELSASTNCMLVNYFKLIRERASGKLKTNARFIREFILKHSDYKGDSRISERITYDLLNEVRDIQQSGRNQELYGELTAKTDE